MPDRSSNFQSQFCQYNSLSDLCVAKLMEMLILSVFEHTCVFIALKPWHYIMDYTLIFFNSDLKYCRGDNSNKSLTQLYTTGNTLSVAKILTCPDQISFRAEHNF
jgi:hypothetical protein